ncbi:hypothetical protein C482_18869 [Natrialba chahannaoensis JCM 10990]|uniref:Uncharacterized protein n=1 Tax=Natrialba chahannaoensis JCM 10990 TaxID=1227492 RepID=M0A658_9EURY|nr:hypothetical protein [Natrialba chahannaoensis]ELY94014.1 hypothetical protein C482_18869 [Natrialba chahannaoensis JCM 10990]
MSPRTEPLDRQTGTDSDVVAAIDEIDGEAQFIIADIARDDAWLSTTPSSAAELEQWR